jgi:hypothetical protein
MKLAEYPIHKMDALDAKITTNILTTPIKSDEDTIVSYPVKNTNNLIWQIDNLLTPDECRMIINSAEQTGFEFLKYRNSERLIILDDKLPEILKDKLGQDDVIKRYLSKTKLIPYGFNAEKYNWDTNDYTVNRCFRINKYNNKQEFRFHRDAQYTGADNIRSAMTLIVYLNDDFTGGETIFRIPKKKYINNGYTVKDELELIGSEYDDVIIQPSCGMAILFDQRILHCGAKNTSSNIKYILRTDIIFNGTIPKSTPITDSKLYSRIYDLSKSLFRQAQLSELYSDVDCSYLYEICIGLRQHPHLITEYPSNLEKHLKNVISDTYDIFNSNMKLIARTGLTFTYSFNEKYTDIRRLLNDAYIYAIYAATDKTLSAKQRAKLSKYFSINTDTSDGDGKSEKCCEGEEYSDEGEEYSNKEDGVIVNGDKTCMLYEYDDLENFIKNKDSKDLENTQLTIECESDIDIIKKIRNPNKFKIGLTKIPFNLVISSNKVEVINECGSVCFVCGNDYRHGYKDHETDNHVGNLYYGKNIEIYTSDNFKLTITKINKHGNTVEGEMQIDAISATFNHASCNCDFYITLGDDDTKVYKEVQFKSQFKIVDNELTIKLIPAIIM